MSFQPNEQLTAQQSESVDPPGVAAGLDLHTAALLRSLGTRLRQMRKSQGLSRRSLSERSGVSSRYLAKVEAGDGNISIGLLIKLAAALEQPVEHFLMADALFHSDLPHVSQLYARADAAMRARVLQVLDPERMGRQKAQRLCLVGLRGAGKSTLGARIADTFDAPFIELNREIEKNAGMALGEIIALYGQEGYRQLEADTLTAIITAAPLSQWRAGSCRRKVAFIMCCRAFIPSGSKPLLRSIWSGCGRKATCVRCKTIRRR